jgi:hypothetical protein
MRKIVLLFVFICFNIAVSGQVINLGTDEIQKIKILEIKNNHGSIENREFEIIPEDGIYTMYEIGTHTDKELIALAKPSLQKVLQKLNKQKGRYKRIIKKLAEKLPPPKSFNQTYTNQEIINFDKVFKVPFIRHPLQSFEIDYYWIKENKEKLWQEFAEKNKISRNDSLDTLVLQNLDNYQLLVKLSKPDNYDQRESFYIHIDFFKNWGEKYEMSFDIYPWGGRKDYNHLISSTVANILPKSRSLTKSHFEEVNFENIMNKLLRAVYDYSISPKMEKLELVEKSPSKFQNLQKHFNINEAEIQDSYFSRRKYLFLDLKPLKLSTNVRYKVLLKPRKNSKQIEKFISQFPEIERQLTSNFIYQYTLQDIHTRTLEIEYSRYRNQALFHNQVEDIKRKFMDKIENLSQQLKNAIEVTFYKDLKGDFQTSHWIILPNGMSVLWNYEGDKLMKMSKNELTSSTCVLFDKNGKITSY